MLGRSPEQGGCVYAGDIFSQLSLTFDLSRTMQLQVEAARRISLPYHHSKPQPLQGTTAALEMALYI